MAGYSMKKIVLENHKDKREVQDSLSVEDLIFSVTEPWAGLFESRLTLTQD